MISPRRRVGPVTIHQNSDDSTSSRDGNSIFLTKGGLSVKPTDTMGISGLQQSSQKTLEKFAQKFEILDIPHSELLEMRHMIEQGLMTTFKQLLLHIMRKCRNVMPDAIARSIGGHIGEEEAQTIKWEQFLTILEEEVAIKEKLFNQMNFGSNKILFDMVERICLSNNPREFFYHDYKVNFFVAIPGQMAENHRNLFQKMEKGTSGDDTQSIPKEWTGNDEETFGMYVMIVNDNCLCLTDEKFSKILSRTYFTRDATKQLKEKVDKENRRQAQEERLRESLKNNISSLSHEEDTLRVQNGLVLGEYHFDIMGHIGGDKASSTDKLKKRVKPKATVPCHSTDDEDDDLQRNLQSRGRGTTQLTPLSDRSARSSVIEKETNCSTNKDVQPPLMSRDNSDRSYYHQTSTFKKVNEKSLNTSSGLKLSTELQKDNNIRPGSKGIEPLRNKGDIPNQNSLTSISHGNQYTQNQLVVEANEPVTHARRKVSSSRPTAQSKFSKSILRPSIILKDVVVGSTTTHPKSTLKTANSWEYPYLASGVKDKSKAAKSKPSNRVLLDISGESRKPSIYATYGSGTSKVAYNLEVASFEDKSELKSKRELSSQRGRLSQRIDSHHKSREATANESKLLAQQNSILKSEGNPSLEGDMINNQQEQNVKRVTRIQENLPEANLRLASPTLEFQQQKRRVSKLLPPIAGAQSWVDQTQKRELYSRAKIDNILSKSVDLARDGSAEGRNRHHKLFNEFRNLISTDIDRLGTGIIPDNVDDYDDGDSYFDEVDVQHIQPLDLMIEYQKRGIITQTKRVANTYMKNSKQLLRKIVKIGEVLGSESKIDTSLAKQDDGNPKNGSALGSEASQLTQQEQVKVKSSSLGKSHRIKTYDKRRLMGGSKANGSVFISVGGYKDPQRLENYKAWHDRPRNGKEMLTCISVFYWRNKGLLLVSFLTRELMAFSFNQYRGEHFIRKLEEIVLEDCANQICILKDDFGENYEYLCMEIGFKLIEVYDGSSICEPANLLKTTINKSKLLYCIHMNWDNPRCKIVRSGMVVVDPEKKLTVHKMLAPRTFGVGFEVSLMQKYRAVTVKDIDFSGKLNLLLVGTNQGDVYLIDCEISLVIFRIHKHRSPIVKLRICEVLKCFMIFWENGRYGLYDLLTYREVQEFNVLEGSDSRRTKCTWGYIPDLDEDMETMIPGKDFFDPIIRQKLGKVIEDRVSGGLYSVFFGESTFSRLKMKIDVELQFSEILAKIKMLERQGKDWSKDTLFGQDISHVVIHKKPVWIFQKAIPDTDSIILINDRKLLVYLNYIECLIVRYSLIQIEGNIVSLEMSNSKREIYIANDRGVAMIYNILHMNAIMKYELNLDRVIYCEFILHDGFDVAMFQVPDEGYVVRSSTSYRTHTIVNVDNPKESVTFRFERELVHTACDSTYVYCLLANYEIAIVSRKNMRMAREFDLMDTPVRRIIEKKMEGSEEITNQSIVSMKINNNVLYLVFEKNLLVVVAFNPNSTNDYRVFTHQLPFSEFLFTVSQDNSFLYLVHEQELQVYQILLIDKYTRQRVFENRLNKRTEKIQRPSGSAADSNTTPRVLRKMNSMVPLDSSESNPTLAFGWSIELPETCSVFNLLSLEFLPSGKNNHLLYLHPKEGALHFIDISKRKYRGELDVSLMIQQNKTFDQKRLNEKNMLNVRNILRGEQHTQQHQQAKPKLRLGVGTQPAAEISIMGARTTAS